MLLLLCACGAAKTSAQTPVRFRTELLEAGQLSCQLVLRADYGEYVRDFTLDCRYTPDEASLQVVEPEIAKGITASVSGEGAKVSYDSTVLAVENFESRRISPMAAPYLLGKAWTEGYIASMGESDGLETTEYTPAHTGLLLKFSYLCSFKAACRSYYCLYIRYEILYYTRLPAVNPQFPNIRKSFRQLYNAHGYQSFRSVF